MVDFITLSCPSCGGSLQITNDIERFACGHCGREHIVNRKGGIVVLSPIVDAIKQVSVGVDKTAAELAILRLQKELFDLDAKRQIIFSNSPKPISNIKSLIEVIIFLTLCFGAISLFGGSYFLLLFPLLIGSSWWGLNFYNNLGWNKNIKPQISDINKRISNLQMNLESHKRIVSK